MRFQIIVCLIVFVIGVAGGFYLALCLQNQIALLAGVAILFAFLTWLGSGAELLGLLRDWYTEQREERKTPTLEFEGEWVNNEPAYFLRVRKTKGEGMAESCEAFLTVEGTKVSNIPTVWAHGNTRHYDIGGHMDLRLFKVEEGHFVGEGVMLGKWITFPVANLDQGFTEHMTHYEEFITKELTIEIHAKNGHLPKPYTKKIAEIIRDAKQKGPDARVEET